jgi:hypothetical protein
MKERTELVTGVESTETSGETMDAEIPRVLVVSPGLPYCPLAVLSSAAVFHQIYFHC